HERLAAYPYGEIIDISQHEGEQIDIDITDLNEFNKEANPVNVIALVEALEKAQKRIVELSEGKVGSALLERENHHVEVVGKLTEHITELESEVEKWKQEAEVWEQVVEKQLATSIKLESRTVKLPPKVDSSNIPFAGHTWNCCLDEVEKRLAAAGIKVEVE
ncbi:TPA: hypothetical protein QHP07_005751, partial [Klebsiella pneumoniae subsp. ozaenae]|nr:hypothetical protein [Klebsiella pneumoniae subsp. ozaenae]HDT2753266.1 hypothetical protein [Klebsiella pneumoniae subsp. ozaenae]